MSLSRKKILIPLILLLIPILSWLVLSQMFDAQALGLQALEHIGQTNGFEICTAQDFQLNLLEGLEISGIEIRGQQASGAVSGTIDRLIFKHQLKPLLSGTLQVDQITLEKPSFELVTSAESADASRTTSGSGSSAGTASGQSEGSSEPTTGSEAISDSEEASGLTLSITSIEIVDGHLRTYDTSLPEEDIEIQGFDLELRDILVAPGTEPAVERLKASGEMRADSLRSGETITNEAVGQLEMEQGQFRLVDFKLDLPQGEIGAQIHADMTKDPFPYTIELAGTLLHTHTFMGLEEPFGVGPSQLTFNGEGFGPNPADFKGAGRLSIGDGLLPPLPVLVQLDQLLGDSSLVGAAYKTFPVQFDLLATRVLLNGLNLEAGGYGLAFEGWLDLEGPLKLQLSLFAPREGLEIKELPREALDALAQEDGRVRIPIQIGGSSEVPEVKLDQAILKGLAKEFVQREIQRGVEKEVGKFLQGLLGKEN